VVAAAALFAVIGSAAVSIAWIRSPSTADLLARAAAASRGHGGTPVPLASIAPVLQRAVVATEDERFYRHHGVDVVGVGRAILYDVSHGSTAEGASTITEQLVKNLYLGGNDHSAWRKLEAAVMAFRAENHLSKAQILDAYLNTVYLGSGATGVEAAARRYFDTSAAHLSLAQASLLAGLIQAPSLDDPRTAPAAARWRQSEVLASMVRNGDVSQARAEAVLASPLPIAGGRALPPLQGVDLSPAPTFAMPDVAAGLLLAAVTVALVVVARRRAWGPLAWLVATPLGLAALVLLARSFQAD
jgi:penicillin-binding protein 1A